MTAMAGERRRYRNPTTNIIEYQADALVAELLGLEPWDGETREVEKDKVTGIEVAVLPEPEEDIEDEESSQDSPGSVTTDSEAAKPAGKPAAGDKK